MAAEAASDLVENTNIHIVKTKHMTQAVECLMTYNVENTLEENLEAMNNSLENMINIEITNAIKDTSINGVDIKEGDFMAIVDGDIDYSNQDIDFILRQCMDLLISRECDIITFLVGTDGDTSNVENMVKYVEERSPFVEVEMINTNQPVYSYIISGTR